MLPWPQSDIIDQPSFFRREPQVGVLLVQHEANSFAIRPTSVDDFVVHLGNDALDALGGANSEFTGAAEELQRLGARVVPLVLAHALPGGPMLGAAFDHLVDLVIGRLRRQPLDAVVLCLHGSLATDDGRSDADLVSAVRSAVGPSVPIAMTLDLHANVTAELVTEPCVVTGYRTNPHIDLADTGRRAVRLLAASVAGRLRPELAIATCPALFPDQSLRVPDGVLGEVLQEVLPTIDPSVIDLSVFPTQPWLDAPGVGFTTLAIAGDDAAAAARAAEAVTAAVWERRADFIVERLLPPRAALDLAVRSTTRPFVLTEAADAPTAGAAGDNPALLAALVDARLDLDAFITLVDPPAVERCIAAGVGATLPLTVGSVIDRRWAPATDLDGRVLSIGEGSYRLQGVGYHGMTASMGRFAVVQTGRTRVLLTETPAWSADPGSWRHAGLEPSTAAVLCVRSCSDYLANFPAAAATSVVIDAPGAASPNLSVLPFRRTGRPVHPVHPSATH